MVLLDLMNILLSYLAGSMVLMKTSRKLILVYQSNGESFLLFIRARSTPEKKRLLFSRSKLIEILLILLKITSTNARLLMLTLKKEKSCGTTISLKKILSLLET